MALWPFATPAQQSGKIRRIGYLFNNPATEPVALATWAAFRIELQRLGWIEGSSVAFELRSANSEFERLPALARDLVQSGVELILVAGGIATSAVGAATGTIPVVFVSVTDPVAIGAVASLARPGANLTGLTNMSRELIGKRLQLLTEVAGGATRFAYLTTSTGGALVDEEAARAAGALGLQWLPVRVSREEDLAGAIAGLADADAWFVSETTLIFARDKVVVPIAALRKPAIYANSTYVRAGGLLSYGADSIAAYRRAAWFVDRILRGTRPADLPVEQPSQFELMVNLKAARAQGLTIPQPVLLRADEVFE